MYGSVLHLPDGPDRAELHRRQRASAQGGWVADSTAGSHNYVCVSEMDINLASNHLAAGYAGCSLLY
ncbi:hypothetical protein OG455_12485 [Kitasatospora sp. NBC_01287]|uniref:hypothetical protein n=1 Tax=Kitasatospora sp. NBC_01287 TaxID=2903573 RepID=UPI002259419A|nr:hypothetical protein [Kitasatospora sp. NBC_01287]MCX4746334.1 hypothetical protein [Kitasatospora sp. NBC_01287]